MTKVMWGAYAKGAKHPTFVALKKIEALHCVIDEMAYDAQWSDLTYAQRAKKDGWTFRKVDVSPHKPKAG